MRNSGGHNTGPWPSSWLCQELSWRKAPTHGKTAFWGLLFRARSNCSDWPKRQSCNRGMFMRNSGGQNTGPWPIHGVLGFANLQKVQVGAVVQKSCSRTETLAAFWCGARLRSGAYFCCTVFARKYSCILKGGHNTHFSLRRGQREQGGWRPPCPRRQVRLGAPPGRPPPPPG